MIISNLVRLAWFSLIVAGSGKMPDASVTDPIRPPTAPAHVRLNLPARTREQLGGGFWQPALTALLDDDWTPKSNLASSKDGAKAFIRYVKVDKPGDLEHLAQPPDLTHTSVRHVSGNGWVGYIEREYDADPGFESVKMTLTRARAVLMVTLTWPAKSESCPAQCDALMRNLVWTLAENKEKADKVN